MYYQCYLGVYYLCYLGVYYLCYLGVYYQCYLGVYYQCYLGDRVVRIPVSSPVTQAAATQTIVRTK